MVGFLNAHGTQPHIYSQFESMWFNPDNDDIDTELGEPSDLAFAHEQSDDDDDWFCSDPFSDDCYCDTSDLEAPLKTSAEIAKWVAERYWYILTELEMTLTTAEVVKGVVQNGDIGCACGGKRSTKLELDAFEIEMYECRRRAKHGRGRQTEICWKRYAGGGRRGRAKLRTMMI